MAVEGRLKMQPKTMKNGLVGRLSQGSRYACTRVFDTEAHSGSCDKCECLACADNLEIKEFEWPLPEDAIKAKAVVFEL